MKILFIFIVLIIIYKLNRKENLMGGLPNNKEYNRAKKIGQTFINNYIEKYNLPKKGAVMFDIDDTLLYVNRFDLIPIKQIIDLLNYCINRGLLIIIITARDSVYRKQTIQDLNDNFINYSFLYLRKNGDDRIDTFKSKVKRELYENNGIEILMSVGDNDIDILGAYSGFGIKLPNKDNPRLYCTSPDGKRLIEIEV